MNTMSKTSITSTNGVTLISLMGTWRRDWRLRPPPAPPAAFKLAAILVPRSRPHVDLARNDRRELVGEGFQPLTEAGGIGRELVIKHHGRNCSEQPERGGEQGLRYARGHDGEARI